MSRQDLVIDSGTAPLLPQSSAQAIALVQDGASPMLADALQFCENADAAPSAAGAYILQIDLAEPVLLGLAGKPPTQLSAGRYHYCGSAYGPGGLRARLGRHMRHGKSAHWHIDHLTERGAVTGAWIVRNGRECDLVAMLAPLPMPIPGFGSSDCARCRSHLLYSPVGDRLGLRDPASPP